MYVIADLSDENMGLYSDYIDEDAAEDLERVNYFGLVACDDLGGVKAAMIWQIKNLKPDAEKESLIEWIRSDDPEAMTRMLDAYRIRVAEQGGVRSTVVIPVRNCRELKAQLMDAGFDMRLSESNLIEVKLSELSRSALMNKMRGKKIPSSIKAIKEVPPRAFRAGIAKCLSKGRTGL